MCELRDELFSSEEDAENEKEEISSGERQSKGLGLCCVFWERIIVRLQTQMSCL